MNESNDVKYAAESHDDGTYVVKKTKKSSILAFVICLLVAFVIWAYTEATEPVGDTRPPVADSTVTETVQEGS